MNLQAIRGVIETPVINALAALDVPVPVFVDNQAYTDDGSQKEYALIRINFTQTTDATLSSFAKRVRGLLVFEYYGPKDIGPFRAQEVTSAALLAVSTINSSVHPAEGAYASIGSIDGPRFEALDNRPHYWAQFSGGFVGAYN